MFFSFTISKKITYFLVFIFCITDIIKCEDPPRISGEINLFGKWMKTQKQMKIAAFLGIPYAKAPIQDLRFSDPQPYGKLNDNYNATIDGDFCPQLPKYNNTEMSVSEDCLRLNIYTRNISAINPVFVLIHGGGLLYGGGQSYERGPQYLLDNDLVLVTINYRLGPFGFLSTKTKDATGNYGLKDQVLALKWVRDNIKHFGGNPDSVTIYGQSAGAWSVSAHLVSPLSKGLFHRAIALSGSSTSAYFIDNLKWTTILAKKANCSNDNSSEVIKCLRKLPWQTIIKYAEFKEEKNYLTNFNIEVEEDFGQERFLVEHPSLAIMNGKFHKVPIITGTTKDEFDQLAHDFANTPDFEKLDENFEVLAPVLFNFEENSKKSSEIAKRIREFYFKENPISKENLHILSEIYSDSTIIHSVHRLAQLARKYVDVYFYRFDYKSRFSCGVKDDKNIPKFVSHTDDVQYIFVHACGIPQYNITDKEQFMVERLNKWFYNFAKTGNPNGNSSNAFDSSCEVWPQSKNDSTITLFNNEKCSIEDEPYQKRMEFWDKLFPVRDASCFSTLYSPMLIGSLSLITFILTLS